VLLKNLLEIFAHQDEGVFLSLLANCWTADKVWENCTDVGGCISILEEQSEGLAKYFANLAYNVDPANSHVVASIKRIFDAAKENDCSARFNLLPMFLSAASKYDSLETMLAGQNDDPSTIKNIQTGYVKLMYDEVVNDLVNEKSEKMDKRILHCIYQVIRDYALACTK